MNSQAGGRETRTKRWETVEGWYDLEVTAQEDPAFRRRLTGRVETGRPGVTA
jgi:phospholipase C